MCRKASCLMKNDNGWNEELNSIKYSEDMNEELPKEKDMQILQI